MQKTSTALSDLVNVNQGTISREVFVNEEIYQQEQEQIFSMIDFEDWRAGSQTGASLRNIAELTLGAPIDLAKASQVLAGALAAATASNAAPGTTSSKCRSTVWC